jgi:hypothetical protein
LRGNDARKDKDIVDRKVDATGENDVGPANGKDEQASVAMLRTLATRGKASGRII